VTSLTCLSPAFPPPSRLPLCIGIDANLYGLVTAIFTVGGLVGSLGSSWVVQKEGVKGGILWSGYLNVVGVLGMGIAPHWIILASGR
jgi:SP family facilitated glucose transporter-like MFS transporter 3